MFVRHEKGICLKVNNNSSSKRTVFCRFSLSEGTIQAVWGEEAVSCVEYRKHHIPI